MGAQARSSQKGVGKDKINEERGDGDIMGKKSEQEKQNSQEKRPQRETPEQEKNNGERKQKDVYNEVKSTEIKDNNKRTRTEVKRKDHRGRCQSRRETMGRENKKM